MIRIHATKKLFDYLDVAEQQPQNQEHPVVGFWHADIVTIQRKKHLIFCHDDSRIVVVLANITKASLKTLNDRFIDVLVNSLLKSGINVELGGALADSLLESTLYFDTDTNRSVQGTLRLRKFDLESMVEYGQCSMEDILEHSVSSDLSNRPNSIKQGNQSRSFWPYDVLGFNLKRAYDYASCDKDLTLECIPSSVHNESDFLRFAQTFNGYEYAEKLESERTPSDVLEELGQSAYAQYKKNWRLPSGLNRLRAVLFYEYYKHHSESVEKSPFKSLYTIKLVDEIRLALKHGRLE